MKLIFGMHLDGWRSIRASTRLDAMTGGLRVLLDQLELRLGLAGPQSSHARRVICFRRTLEAALNEGPRFYAKSFSKDPLATSEVLLRWRDELVMGGWRGQVSGKNLERLYDLAAVEASTTDRIRTGDGDRICRIMDLLNRGVEAPLALVVVDDRSHLPHLLVQLLDKLGAVFEKRPSFPLATAGSNLRQAQEALLGQRKDIMWNGCADESLMVCTAFSEITLAEVAAHWISRDSIGEDVGDGLLLTTSDPAPVVAALRGLDAPLPGSSQVSVERPILQMLRLALRLRWQPMNPQHLLEFLMHPVSPLPSFLRHRLAKAVADRPGIGGQGWNDAVANARKQAESWSQDGANAPENLEAKIQDWLLGERFDPRTGAPAAALVETCQRVRKWAMSRASKDLDPDQMNQWQLLAAHASELSELVAELREVKLTELEQLVTLVQGQGIARGESSVELGSIPRLSDPGAILESVSELFWWCVDRATHVVEAPWTRPERESLASMDVVLLSTESLIEAQHASAMLPLLAARKSVRLFLPKQRAGESVEHHPLLDELQARAGSPVPMLDLDEIIGQSEHLPGLKSQPRQSLPKLQRWWKLRVPELLHPRKVESFSSLEKFVFQPFAWVLQYCARLEEGVIGNYSIKADVRQRGNLMHRITEKLFAPENSLAWQTASEAQFREWLDALWPGLLVNEAANLLLAGMQSDAERLKQQTQRSLWRLIQHLRIAGVQEAHADVVPARAGFRNGASISGRIDLLVKRAAAPFTAVVDLKYGSKERRQRELKENVPLQLGVYGYLLASEFGAGWPETAYFILSNSSLLAQDTMFFPDASLVQRKGGTTGSEACWNDFLKVWDWRRGQMNEGWIEVSVEGTQSTDGGDHEPCSAPPDPRWIPDPKAPHYDDFKALTGWEEQA